MLGGLHSLGAHKVYRSCADLRLRNHCFSGFKARNGTNTFDTQLNATPELSIENLKRAVNEREEEVH